MRIHVPHGLRARIGVDVGDQVVLLREGTWLMIASAAILAPMIRWANTVRRSRNDAREAGSDGGSFVMAAPTVEVILRLMDAENLTIADLEQARHGKGITVAEYLDEALAP